MFDIAKTCPCCKNKLGYFFIYKSIILKQDNETGAQIVCQQCKNNVLSGNATVRLGLFAFSNFLLGLYFDDILTVIFNRKVPVEFELLLFGIVAIVLSIVFYYLIPLKCNIINKKTAGTSKVI